MMTKLLVLADLGKFKAYRFNNGRNFSTPQLELIEAWDTNVAHHLGADVTDQAGQFRKGHSEGASPSSDGEQHNIDLERRRRAVKRVARRIGELLRSEPVEGCYLAAASEINKTLIDELDQDARARIHKNVTANLTSLKPAEVIAHFCA